MITPAEATTLIRDAMPDYPTTVVPLEAAHGHILREPVVADRDLPPFDRVTMDGIAMAYAAWQAGTRSFRIESTANAGAPAPALTDRAAGCVQVMTGAMLPDGADTVIPLEELSIEDDVATLRETTEPAPLQNLHSRGSDRPAGGTLLTAGITLNGPHLSIAAAVGKAQLTVAKRPTIAIISTGDELRDVSEPVEPYQIRSASEYGIQGALRRAGYDHVHTYRIKDDLEETIRRLEELLLKYDVLILTGGVSMGKRDYVPAALAECGVSPVFHKVSQKPGKPMWFGVHPSGRPVFALPGNPVSTLVCLHRYVIPALHTARGGAPQAAPYVMLAEPVRFAPPLTGFVPVTLVWDAEGFCRAQPQLTNTSGDFASLSNSSGFVELPAEQDCFPTGYAARYYPWL